MEVAPARSVEQLIGARTPGLIVLPSTGQVGTGAQLRVRAASSLTLSNDPIIYIDGVRMDASAARGPVQRGGAGASRLNDVSAEDIESIEVIKGPAAATLYGTEASNGVIQIITKRGKSGKAQFGFTTRQGSNWLANPEGRAGMLYAPGTGGGPPIGFNLYQHEVENGKGPIFSTGQQGYQGNVTGGTDASRYYLSGTATMTSASSDGMGPKVHGQSEPRHPGRQRSFRLRERRSSGITFVWRRTTSTDPFQPAGSGERPR
jgi:TonB-dependent SusC/RagA subfamily outer membrane receptor